MNFIEVMEVKVWPHRGHKPDSMLFVFDINDPKTCLNIHEANRYFIDLPEVKEANMYPPTISGTKWPLEVKGNWV